MIKILYSIVILLALITPSYGNDKWPERTIKVIVPVAAGNGTDVVARKFMSLMEKELNQKIIIENKPGGSTLIGTSAAANAQPDGYTFLYAASSSLYSSLLLKPSYDFNRDFIPLGATITNKLCITTNVKHKTESDFILHIKNNGSFFGTTGFGSAAHIFSIDYLKNNMITNSIPVPYRGTQDAINELIADRLDFYFTPLSTTIGAEQTNTIRVFRNTCYENWNGVFAVKNTPSKILSTMKLAMQLVNNNTEYANWVRANEGDIPSVSMQSLIDKDISLFNNTSLDR